MKSTHLLLALALTLLIATPRLQAQTAPSIVPKPEQMRLIAGKPFTLNKQTEIAYNDESSKAVALLLAEALRPATSLPLLVTRVGTFDAQAIVLTIVPSKPHQDPEAYTLLASEKKITLTASSSRGLFNATQTLLQLLPVDIYSGQKLKRNTWSIPAISITDAPTYKWRGMMLDVSRYFFNKDYIKRYLDMMALHKMNVFHWHLIDDPGWRIEIKKYPKLTEIGAWRGTGDSRHGGFYTQDDIREIVAYATARNITIVPEIEIPAHTLPAIVAYPHLGCFNKQYKVPTGYSISPEIYCAGKETTWKFLEDVFTEVCALFPGTYIHIGGDEARFDRWNKCPDCQARMKKENLKTPHELQGWMTTRIEKFLKTKKKRIVGWQEILETGVSTQAGIMPWMHPKTAVTAANRGNPVVMAITSHTYFDVGESHLPGEPPTATWIPPISLKKAYSWDPTPKGLSEKAAKNILGANGCVWSDRFISHPQILADKLGKGTAVSEAYVDYLSLPRMAALAEVTWTVEASRNYTDFVSRMRPMLARYSHRGYQYRIPVPEISVKTSSNNTILTASSPAIDGGSIRYTTDGSTPTASSKILPATLTFPKSENPGFRAATFTPDNTRHSLLFQFNKFAKHGEILGLWKSGKIGNRKAKEVTFNATKHINSNGSYIITFLYTGGKERLDIDGIKIVLNDSILVGQDIHHGFTGFSRKNNTYKIKVTNYQPQADASYKIKAMIYGHESNDSNGAVLIKKLK